MVFLEKHPLSVQNKSTFKCNFGIQCLHYILRKLLHFDGIEPPGIVLHHQYSEKLIKLLCSCSLGNSGPQKKPVFMSVVQCGSGDDDYHFLFFLFL